MYASYVAQRETLTARLHELETKLDVVIAESAKGAWKRSNAKESKRVVDARDAIFIMTETIREFDVSNELLLEFMSEQKKCDERDAEFADWICGKRDMPEYLKERDSAEHEEFIDSCSVLKPYTNRENDRDKNQDQDSRDNGPWVPITIEAYLKELELEETPIVEYYSPVEELSPFVRKYIAAYQSKHKSVKV
jgi:hypothetical protein